MDGGYLEAEMMAKAGASFVVVMGRAHEATVRRVVDAARDFGIKVMGDNLGADDRIANAQVARVARRATTSSITSATTSAAWSRA